MEKTLKILIIITSILAILAVGLTAVSFLQTFVSQSFYSSSQKSDENNADQEAKKPSSTQEIKENLLKNYVEPDMPVPEKLPPGLP